MNNGVQGQPAQGQPAGPQQQSQQRSGLTLYKPEQMRNLPEPFTQAEKSKWEAGLRTLWNEVDKNAADIKSHQDAKRKLYEFSKTLAQKMQQHRQAQQSSGGPRPNSQGQAQQGQGENGSGNSNIAQPARPPGPNKIPEKMMQHVNAFPYTLPSQLSQGTPEAAKWLKDAKSRYLKALMQMESVTARLQGLDNMMRERTAQGKPLSPEEEKEFGEKKELAQKSHAEAKHFVDNFRTQQQQARAAVNQANPSQQQGGGNGNSNNGGSGVPPRLATQQPPNPALQNTQTVNAAIEAARNQQINGGRPPMQPNSGHPGQQNSQVSQTPLGQIQNAPSHPNMPPQQGGPAANIKAEAGFPPLNTSAVIANQIQQGNQGRSMQNNSPQSAIPQSATSTGPPRPLTHQAALSQAARSYSSGQTSGTPNVMGHSHAHPSSTPRETPNSGNKMPIPKHLPERATALPLPVPMGQPRPTFSGGPSNAGGAMGQPVLPKTPGYNLEGEGERVLNKKKLDELVRQVTGGGEGLDGGEGLTAEVEESILNVADGFVDQVLTAACKNAKERGSKILEIRDIQLTLERGYNIRIPGYASDEIRTVRKIQPSAAWISKMSAVQAAKVTGGKGGD